jgi:Cu/Ag efflux protein CusF
MNRNAHARWTIAVALLLCLLTIPLAHAQQSGKKQYAFKGTVEKVDTKAKTLTVKNEDIPGWMMAMTMSYKTDKPEVLDHLKAGDKITATVYEGDAQTLYNIKVGPPAKK